MVKRRRVRNFPKANNEMVVLKLEFGASTYIWESPFTTDNVDLTKRVADLGFDIIEICVEDPSQIDTERLKNGLQNSGIKATVCGAFGESRDISSEQSDVRESGLKYIKRCIDIANEIGSPIVVGPMYSATGKARLATPSERNQQRIWALENIKIVSEYALERNVSLAIEPLNRFETDFMNTTEQGMEFIEKLGVKNVGLLLDTFHMNIEETDVCAAIRTAKTRLFHFHACENDRGIPGSGHCPWNEIALTLQEIKYEASVVIEAFTIDNTEIARAVSLWRQIAPTQESIATEGLSFLKKLFS